MDTKELKSIARFYKDCERGFATNDWYYAIPVMNSTTMLAIVHEGEILKYFRNEESSRNYVTNHRKTK